MKVKLTFTEPVLGTLAGNPELAKDHILSKHKDGAQTDELDSVEAVCTEVANGSTVLHGDENGNFLFDYQFRGFLKSAILATMIESGEYTKESLKKLNLSKWTYKRQVDTQMFVNPRKIYLDIPDGKDKMWIERPLRAETMRGERIALARSEAAPDGTTCVLEFECISKNLKKLIPMLLDYGKFHGMGQWRGGGFGRFTWELVD